MDENTSKNKRLAAVDLGSNSFHMIIASVGHGHIQVIERYRNKVQMAKYLEENNLQKEGIERGLKALQAMKDRLSNHQVEKIRCVATNTFRVATNVKEFVIPAEQILEVPVEVISGEEEARLVYHGACDNLEGSAGNLVIDIGGGSTEVIAGSGQKINALESFLMGCVSFKKQFFNEDMAVMLGAIKAAATALINEKKEKFLNEGWDMAHGCSGSVRAAFEARGYDAGQTITLDDLNILYEDCINNPDFSKMKELRTDRVDVFPTGLAILTALFECLDIKEMHLSKGALREGVLYQLCDSTPSTV